MFEFQVITDCDQPDNYIYLGPFSYHAVSRPVSKGNNRYFGGLAILRKDHVKSHVKILTNTNPDYQWIKLEKQFFGFTSDLYICLVYNPPSVSSYSKKTQIDIIDCLEKDIVKYKKLGNITLCGDFNARVGSKADLIVDDSNKFTPLYDSYDIDNQIMIRHSMDDKCDTRGQELLDLCIGQQLRLLNGRTLGDTFGNLTCYTSNGTSTVDYVIVSENIFDQILYFKVSDFTPTLSDCHCKLEWQICASYSARDKVTENVQLSNMSQNFIWSDGSEQLFQNALLSDDIQKRLVNLSNRKLTDTDNIISASADFTSILTSAAHASLKRCRINTKKTTEDPQLTKIKTGLTLI